MSTITLSSSQAAKQITLIGAIVNLFLAIFKITIGTIGNSHALVADGVHSFADLLSDALVWFATHFGAQAADVEHPYGHKRIETVATVFLSLLLMLAGFGIVIDAAEHLYLADQLRPSYYVLLAAMISVVANEILYRYTNHVGLRINSALLKANAWHHRSDAASSIVVLVGVTGSLFGLIYLDALAAIIVGIMVLIMGWQFGWSSLLELIDTGADEETLEKIQHIIVSSSGVREVHQLRTRSMAGNMLVDVHVQVDPRISVSEGHHIAQQVHFVLMREFENIVDVIVHIDPEDDEIHPPSLHLPSREDLLPLIQKACQDLPQAKHITLHYLAGQLEVDMALGAEMIKNADHFSQLQVAYTNALKQIPFVKGVKLVLI